MRNGKKINAVYTRKGFRRNGYAERLVGEVCKRLLEELEYVLPRGEAAGIYRKLGFGGDDGREFFQKDVREDVRNRNPIGLYVITYMRAKVGK